MTASDPRLSFAARIATGAAAGCTTLVLFAAVVSIAEPQRGQLAALNRPQPATMVVAAHVPAPTSIPADAVY